MLLYLRANQLKLLNLRPILFSETYIASHKERVVQAVDVANDTISVTAELEMSSDLYRNRQPIFNHFLTSALAVLFLAYGQQIRNGIPLEYVRAGLKIGPELARSLCELSSSSRRLLNLFSRLKELVSRLIGESSTQIRRSDPLTNDQERSDWTFSPAPLQRGLSLDEDFEFFFLFKDLGASGLAEFRGKCFGPQAWRDINSGLQDYSWVFQDL